MRIAVLGANGKMGRCIVDAVLDTPDLELMAVVDTNSQNLPGPDGVQHLDTIENLLDCDVVIDFTVATAARKNIPDLLQRGINVVSGTTGLTAADFDNIEHAAKKGKSSAIVAANFAIGAVLLMKFAELAAPYFRAVEILEFHHDEKRDAPSGTAMVTAERIAARRKQGLCAPMPEPTEQLVAEGARGALGPGGIRVHSVRLSGFVAHEEVIMGDQGQTLTIRHDSIDRSSFVAGVLLAVRHVLDQPGLTIGIDSLLA